MKKLLSLFTILCCIFTFASFPALAVEASAQVVTFSDNFETETDTVPDNWQLFKETSKATATIETENGNKFLRVNPTEGWKSGNESSAIITKSGMVNLPTDDKIVVVKMKMRSKEISNVDTRQNVRLSYHDPYTDTSKSNEKVLFVTRDFGAIKDIFCFATTSDNSVINSDYSVANNTWYDVTAIIDFSASKVNYIVGNQTSGYKRYSINIKGSTLASLEVIDCVTVLLDQVNANNYTDIDDVSVYYLPEVKNFYDNFESETDDAPDKWVLAETSQNTTATVETEANGNKYLHLQLNSTTAGWNKGIAAAVIKSELVSMPLTDKPVLVKYRTRLNIDLGSAPEFYVKAAVPGGASAAEDTSNKYKLVDIRKKGGVGKLGHYGTAGDYPRTEDYIGAFNEGVWYDIYALVDPTTSLVKYTFGNEAEGYVVYNYSKFEKIGFASVDVINNLYLQLLNANPGLYMDLDDVYIGYPEDYADYLPNVLSFEDTFEDAALNSVPANWVDRAGVSTVKVMEETGNKFVRVTKNKGTKGVPQVATKDGVINRPWRGENGKGFVVEAKIRQQNQTYRSLLMLNAPYLPTAVELGQNIGTPFYIHTNLQAYNMPEYKATDGVVKLNEWVHYRAVIIPGETQTTIHHYINDVLCYTTPTSAIKMPELFNPDSLYKVSFGWRSDISGTNDETVETEGYMDFDDVKVYEMTDFIHKITVTDANGAKIDKLVNGTVNVNANVINNGKTRQVDVIAALYSKDGDNWKLTETKKVVNSDKNSYVYAYAWKQGLANASLDVNDADQMLKVFVWNRAIDNDSNPANAETLTPMNPVCAPIVITR